jgi:hypothetical protein
MQVVIKEELAGYGDELWMAARLAEYNPIRMKRLLEECTVTDLALGTAIKAYDNSFEVD